MNKVLQAAGRVIRTMEDVGIIALLDERFLQTPALYPAADVLSPLYHRDFENVPGIPPAQTHSWTPPEQCTPDPLLQSYPHIRRESEKLYAPGAQHHFVFGYISSHTIL